MDIKKITGIGRPMDYNYPTNRLISVLTVAVVVLGMTWQLITGTPILTGFFWGLGAGVTIFITWALTREIDPDNNLPAFIASFLMIVAIFFFYPPDFLALIWFLLISRVINRTTGLHARISDGIIITMLSIWLTYKGFWIYAAVGGVAFMLDSSLPDRNKRQWIFATLHLAILFIVWILGDQLTGLDLPGRNRVWLFSILAVFYIPVIITSTKIRSITDNTGEPLYPIRIKATQITAAILALEVSIWHGENGFIHILPLWAGILGSALFRYYLLMRKMPK